MYGFQYFLRQISQFIDDRDLRDRFKNFKKHGSIGTPAHASRHANALRVLDDNFICHANLSPRQAQNVNLSVLSKTL